MILIDHVLGGGVKDCWVTSEVEQTKEMSAAAAQADGYELDEYSPSDTLAILQKALAADTCAVEEDQIEDVNVLFEMLQRRVETLAEHVAAQQKS